MSISIRIKQLQRQFDPILSSSESDLHPEIKSIVKSFIFGNSEISSIHKEPIYELQYSILNQIDLLSQIYSRSLSNLASQDPDQNTSQKLIALGIFGELMIHTLASSPINGSILQCTENIILEKTKFEFYLEQLKALKKPQNKSVTNFEGILNHILERAPSELDIILQIKSWNALLDYTFGLSSQKQEDNIKEIEFVNIKELLLSYTAQGQLISDVFARYDALLAFAMSMLTMLSGSPYSDTFTDPINRLLDGVGSATRMVLLQTRMSRALKQYTKITTDLNGTITHYFTIIENDNAVNSVRAKKILEPLKGLEILNSDAQYPQNLDNLTGFNSMFPSPESLDIRKKLIELWNQFLNNYAEIMKSLQETKEYFDSMIKNANRITSDLFSKGFQAAIPLHDVETIEKVGLHIKNIVATSSSQKVSIDSEYFDTRHCLYRKFEEEMEAFQTLILKKAHEEGFLKYNLPQDLKNLRDIFAKIQIIIGEWNSRAMFTGYGEECPLASRILKGAHTLIQDLRSLLVPLSKNSLTTENFAEYVIILKDINTKFNQFTQFAQVANLLNDISKNLFLLNREFTFQFGKFEEFIENPSEIKQLVESIPKTLKIESQQKLIPKELRDAKMKVFEKLVLLIDQLNGISPDFRQMVPGYELIMSC